MKTPYFYIPLVSTLYRGVRRNINLIRYWGKDIECPVCANSFRKEASQGICPYCGSSTRHKALVVWLQRFLAGNQDSIRTLMFAPDFGVERWLRARRNIELTTTDYSAPNVDYHCDILNIPEPDASFDLIICSHVMEHIQDDLSAYKELARVLKPGGVLIIQVPYAKDEARTDEDPTVTDPLEREKRWGQFDHVRLYGQDIASRLSSAGLVCTVRPLEEWISAEDFQRFALWNDVIFECRK